MNREKGEPIDPNGIIQREQRLKLAVGMVTDIYIKIISRKRAVYHHESGGVIAFEYPYEKAKKEFPNMIDQIRSVDLVTIRSSSGESKLPPEILEEIREITDKINAGDGSETAANARKLFSQTLIAIAYSNGRSSREAIREEANILLANIKANEKRLSSPLKNLRPKHIIGAFLRKQVYIL